jgi:signal transduction histidine kinase
MKGGNIRERMALASILPVLLVVVTIAGVFWQGRVQDLEASHQQRTRLLVHQVALFSGYGLFSGNTASLQNVVKEIQREQGVQLVVVFDANGEVLARSGPSDFGTFLDAQSESFKAGLRAKHLDMLIESVIPMAVPMDDMFTPWQKSEPQFSAPLGNAMVVVSRKELYAKKRDALLTALWVGAAGMLLGGLLAFRLGDWVVGPLVRITRMVRRIGEGDFTLAPVISERDPLKDLQTSLNQMAQRLAWGREELEQQVEEVTHELRIKKDQAESATQAKSRFLAAASHDLRQPSHALGMFVARLGQLPMDAQMRQLVDNLQVSVQEMQDLLDGLLDLSRLDSGNIQVRMAPVDLNELLSSVRSALSTMAQTKGLRLRVRPTRLWALSDVTLLSRMLANLVINAIRYTERGTVLVCCRPHALGVRIEVWDSGIGIPVEHHQDIFKEFYQLASRAGDRNFGMGLGLNIVQRSAMLLGHRIVLRSSPGCGTRFSILLQGAEPMQRASAEDLSAMQALQGDLTGLRILLIEDNDNAREAVRQLLQAWGCEVAVAKTLVAAQAQLQVWGVPEVILSDFHLGAAENGIECIAALRAMAGSEVPACLMSGDTDDAFLQAVKTAELPLLHKPVRPAKLRSLLRRMVP